MKTSPIGLKDSIQELFFIIAPPPHIISDASVLKDDIQYLIGHKFDGRYVKAHISLFSYTDKHIDDMIEFVESRSVGFKAFNVFIKDFGVYHNGDKHAIYMDIVNKYPIRDVFEKLVMPIPEFMPRITLAKNLSNEDFLKTWPYLKGLQYNQHFTCDRITVWARTGKKWIHYKDIMFEE